jgi:hypothetical protein
MFVFIFKWAISKYTKPATEKFIVGQSDELDIPKLNADITPSSLQIPTKPDLKTQGKFISNLASMTKGDGVLRNVDVDGHPLPQEIVALAMFDNHDFAPHTDQFPLVKQNQLEDTKLIKQRDFFAKK